MQNNIEATWEGTSSSNQESGVLAHAGAYNMKS